MFYGRDRPLFFHLLILFFYEKILKSAVFLDKNLNEKLWVKRAKKIMIFKLFFGVILATKCKQKLKICTDRPLFGISSLVEQGVFFSWPKIYSFFLICVTSLKVFRSSILFLFSSCMLYQGNLIHLLCSKMSESWKWQ